MSTMHLLAGWARVCRVGARPSVMAGVLSVVMGLGVSLGCRQVVAEPLDLILMDGAAIERVRDEIQSGQNSAAIEALEVLKKKANASLKEPMTSVVNKPQAPASGDMHDYVSLSPYWWPNPDTENGLPYIRKDGRVNPEREKYDMPALDTMSRAVWRLGFAYYFTGDERYAENAAERLRVWFLDEKTRMNPRLKFSQFIPGVHDGGHYGIIETLRLRWVPDAITMLASSDALSDDEVTALRQWFGDYKDWLLTSDMGQQELAGPNNHGSWCAQQIVLYARVVNDSDTVRRICETIPARIAAQFEPDGSQPIEIARTRGLDYSEFNVRALMDLAYMAQTVGIDLWHYETADGRSIQRGLDFILPSMTGEKPWPYKQIKTPKHEMFVQGLRRAAIGFNAPVYNDAIKHIPTSDESQIWLDLILVLPQDFPASE